MKRDLPDDAEELRSRVRELRSLLLIGTPGAFFPPLAGLALDSSRQQLVSLLEEGSIPTEPERLLLYIISHETVHVAQMVHSRWLFGHVRELIDLCTQTMRQINTGENDNVRLEKLRASFRSNQAALTKPVHGFSALQVIEAQAVIEGLRITFPDDSADDIVAKARSQYGENAADIYLPLLERVVDVHGTVAAVLLVPRLCTCALAFDSPGGTMADLLSALEQMPRSRVDTLVRMPLDQFVVECGLEPAELVKTARENGWSGTEGAADLLMSNVLSPSLDRYEQLPHLHTRLKEIMHPSQTAVANGLLRGVFKPKYALFGNDECMGFEKLGVSTSNTTDFAYWVSVGLSVLDAVHFLATGELSRK